MGQKLQCLYANPMEMANNFAKIEFYTICESHTR